MFDERVFGLCEDFGESGFVEGFERGDDGESADELGDESELEQIFGFEGVIEGGEIAFVFVDDVGVEAHGTERCAFIDDIGESDESAAADE